MSLDASAYRLVASLCRTVKGRQAVQTSGMLRRCVERFHLSGGVRGVDLVCRGEIACVFARIANSHTVESGTAGSANDYILNPNYNTVALLVELVREGSKFYRRARFWATFALAELCKDTVRVVPLVIKWGGVPSFAQIIKDYTRGGGEDPKGVPQPLLRPVLMALLRICKFPMGGYTQLIIDAEARQVSGSELGKDEPRTCVRSGDFMKKSPLTSRFSCHSHWLRLLATCDSRSTIGTSRIENRLEALRGISYTS